MNSVLKGRVAEAKITAWLTEHEYEVFVPVFGNAVCDAIVLVENRPLRIETKYVTGRQSRNSIEVSLRQTRANRSETVIKKFNAEQCDLLGVYVAPWDAVAWFTAAPLHGRTSVSVHPEDVNDVLPVA